MDKKQRRAAKDRKRKQQRKAGAPAGPTQAARAPRHSVDAYLNTSHGQIQRGEFADAVRLLGNAVKEHPEEPRLLDNLAFALDRAGRHDDAVRATRMRAKLTPDEPTPHHTLAALLKFQGKLDEARQAARRALAVDPHHAEAWANLATLKRFEDAADPELEGLRAAHAAAAEGSPARMHLDFALGKALEDLGRVDDAFACYAAGNRVKRGTLRYDLGTFRALAQTVMGTQGAAWVGRGPGPKASTEAPVLVVGMPRSGSTLIEQILSSHPDCEGIGEEGLLGRTLAEVGSDPLQRVRAVEHLAPEEFTRLGRVYARRLSDHAPRARRVVDKFLMNFLHLGFVARALPNARFVHARRDPMDNGFACYKVLFQSPLEFVYDLRELGGFQVILRELMAHWARVLPDRLIEVDYEALVADQEAETRRLLDFLGLEWDARCLRFDRTERHVTSASSAQVRRPMYSTSVGRWRPYAAHLGELRAALGDLAPAE